jgi:hypothetical protein
LKEISAKTGLKFDCRNCSKEIQAIRRCNEDSWDNTGAPFPIQLFEGSQGHTFCPSKLFRDDHEFCSLMETYYLSWQLGQCPNGEGIDSMKEEEVNLLNNLIMSWQYHDKADKFKILSMILGGTK